MIGRRVAVPWRLGKYAVQGKIGQGAMGEVFRGHDPMLQRDVAIKVLPAVFAADADRLRRCGFAASKFDWLPT